MHSINHYIANSAGELTGLINLIETSLQKVIPIVEKELSANKIDIIFISAPSLAIPEYGIGGNSPGPHHIYISFDPESDKITAEGLIGTLLHEIHHCMRWREPGYGETLGEAMVSEGLACLYETEHNKKPPLYAEVTVSDSDIEKAMASIGSSKYDHAEWFFGSKKITRWFGYAYGYRLCKAYAVKHSTNASDMVGMKAVDILNDNNLA